MGALTWPQELGQPVQWMRTFLGISSCCSSFSVIAIARFLVSMIATPQYCSKQAPCQVKIQQRRTQVPGGLQTACTHAAAHVSSMQHPSAVCVCLPKHCSRTQGGSAGVWHRDCVYRGPARRVWGGPAGALTCAPVQDTRPRSRLPGSILYFWKMGSFRSSSTLSLGMKGNRTSCSTVSRTVPSPYLQRTALSQQETSTSASTAGRPPQA